MLDLRRVFGWLPDAVMFGRGDEMFAGISTDTRSVKRGDLFIALRGDRFDAHDFIDAAIDAGAAGIITERQPAQVRVPTLWVPNSRVALGALAAGWRRQFACPLIAVTGSNGKTTAKEMIAAILAAHAGEEGAFATRGNFNNDVGVPLTLLRLRGEHRMGVVEMGMNHPGEIALLAAMARPEVALVLNAQREHQEFMDGPEATAHENGSVFAHMATNGVAVFPGDDPCTPIWQQLTQGRRVMSFGLADDISSSRFMVAAHRDARPDAFTARLCDEDVQIRLQIAGRHSVRNALAAAACALALGVPAETIARGLAAFRPVKGRLRSTHTATGLPMVDDTYNANPDSMRAAIDVLADMPSPRLLVMGDMGETGDQAEAFHREVGEYARERGIERIWAVGAEMRAAADGAGENARHWADVETLLAAHPQTPSGVGSALVKGSRFMRMERIVDAWAASPAQAGEH